MNRRIIVSCFIKCKDKYLFIKQNKKGGAYQDCLHIVGGGLEENEPSMRFLRKLGLI